MFSLSLFSQWGLPGHLIRNWKLPQLHCSLSLIAILFVFISLLFSNICMFKFISLIIFLSFTTRVDFIAIFLTPITVSKYSRMSINIRSGNKWELKCITKKLNKILKKKKNIKADFQDKISIAVPFIFYTTKEYSLIVCFHLHLTNPSLRNEKAEVHCL